MKKKELSLVEEHSKIVNKSEEIAIVDFLEPSSSKSSKKRSSHSNESSKHLHKSERNNTIKEKHSKNIGSSSKSPSGITTKRSPVLRIRSPEPADMNFGSSRKTLRKVLVESSDSDSDAETRKAIKSSAEKRIILNLSTSESDSRVLLPSNEDPGSDSAPEDITFEAGRQSALLSLKGAAESIKLHKQLKKEKRRLWLEMIKQQKEEKLIRLKEKKASQEDASCSSSEESVEDLGFTMGSKGKKHKKISEEQEIVGELKQKHKKVSKGKGKGEDIKKKKSKKTVSLDKDGDGEEKTTKLKKKRKLNIQEVEKVEKTKSGLKRLPDDLLEDLMDEVFPTQMAPTNDEEMLKEEKKKKKRKELHRHKKPKQEVATGSGVFHIVSDIDYIPLEFQGATNFGVVPLEQTLKVRKTRAETSADYKRSLIYGTRINRVPARSLQAYKQKLKAAGKDRK